MGGGDIRFAMTACVERGPVQWPARSFARRSLRQAALRLDQLVRFDDLLSALLGVLDHRLRQAVGFQLVRVVTAQLAAIRFDDFAIAAGS